MRSENNSRFNNDIVYLLKLSDRFFFVFLFFLFGYNFFFLLRDYYVDYYVSLTVFYLFIVEKIKSKVVVVHV